MFDRPNAWNELGRCRFIFVVSVILSMWGCAALAPQTMQRDRVCDDAADAAVERQDWNEARIRHQALLQDDPGNCLAIYHLGYIYGQLDDRVEEARHYERAVQCGLDTDDLLFYNLGMAYGEMSLLEEALAAFERAVALNPQNAENFFGLGLIAQADGQTERALSALVKAVDIDPHHWEARIILTRIYLDKGQLAAARIHLDKLRGSVPDNDEVVELWQTYEDRAITTYGD
jgi:tetratricopeptide (TPR) repeat protein